MKSGVSLQQMLTEVKRQSESKEDYLIAPNRLRMESYGKEMFLHLSDDSGTELIEPMTITGIAHRQIGTHLRIPAAYYDRMREERPDLLAYNANTWFKQENSQRMLRTLDGSARAYLSNRYRRIDNIDIAGGVCEACALSQFGSASNGRGKACKNMRVLYLLRSGEFMPLAINLSPTSISPFREFLNQGFVFRNRATYGSLVEIGLKRQTNPEGKDYSVATFKRLGDFHGDQLAAVRKYALSFREQIRGMNRQRIEAKREQDDGLCEVESYTAAPAAADDSFCIGATVNGDTQPLPA